MDLTQSLNPFMEDMNPLKTLSGVLKVNSKINWALSETNCFNYRSCPNWTTSKHAHGSTHELTSACAITQEGQPNQEGLKGAGAPKGCQQGKV
jgi:hypothetical protein